MKFINFIKEKIKVISSYISWINKDWEDKSLILTSKIIMSSNTWRNRNYKNISDKEFRVFSQWGDDGIIQFLIHELQVDNETFIEFGVGNYFESNTHFLLVNNNWSGFIIDGSKKCMDIVINNIKYIVMNLLLFYFDFDFIDISIYILFP